MTSRKESPYCGVNWTAKSRCAPNVELEIERLRKQIARQTSRIRGKGGRGAEREVRWNDREARADHQNYMMKKIGVLEEGAVIEIKKELKDLVRCPMDKNSADGMIV